jgi:hypothetical protein
MGGFRTFDDARVKGKVAPKVAIGRGPLVVFNLAAGRELNQGRRAAWLPLRQRFAFRYVRHYTA